MFVVILCKSSVVPASMLINMASVSTIDELDARLIELLSAVPRIGVLECARRLAVARGTVQARLDKLTERGVISGFGPQVNPAALGFTVTAFITLEIEQVDGHSGVSRHLASIPEVLEAHTVTGSGDLMCRIVARTNADLQRVIDLIVSFDGVERASSVIALAEQVSYRTLPLVREAAGSVAAPPSPPQLSRPRWVLVNHHVAEPIGLHQFVAGKLVRRD